MAGATEGVFDVSYIDTILYLDFTILNPETSLFVANLREGRTRTNGFADGLGTGPAT